MYQTIESIKEEYERKITVLRRNILYMLPEEFQEILSDYYICKTRKELYLYMNNSIEKITEAAEPLDIDKDEILFYLRRGNSERANCPLCRDTGSEGMGYSLPLGLERHLKGYGNMQQCIATKAIFDLATDYYDKHFKDKEEENKALHLKNRRQTETLFQIDPDEEPQLIDEYFYGENYRDAKGIEWAGERLIKMEFIKSKEGNILSFVKDYGDFVMYADIRAKKRISFDVFIKPNTAHNKNKAKYKKLYSNIHILDGWSNDLTKKIDDRFQKLIKSKGF